MKLTYEDRDNLTVMRLQGEFTADDFESFRKQVADRFSHNVHDFVLDMDPLEFVDSVGLETLLWLQDEVTERLGQVRLACVDDDIKEVLRITRLASRFDCHPNIESAISSLK